VPDDKLGTLTARMHTGRGGQMAPYGDDPQGNSETRQDLGQVVRERAYLLWENKGRLEGRAEEYWHRALWTSTFGSGLTFCGSRKAVPKGDRTNTGVGLPTSRASKFLPVRQTSGAAGTDDRAGMLRVGVDQGQSIGADGLSDGRGSR